MNRAGIYDVTNGKVWTYYTNDTTWHSTTNTTQVTINTFTNSSEGTIKGSTNVGQIFAEADGTGSVNGWDALNDAVENNSSDISDLQTAVDGKQDKLIAGANINIAADGKTISATDTTYTAGNAIDITNGEISADIHPTDFFTASDSISDYGSDLSLDNTIATTLKSVELKGDTFQQTYSGKNLFNGTYVNYAVGGSSGYRWFTANNTRSAIVKCQPNTTYTIKKYELSSNRFAIADYPSMPSDNGELNGLATDPSATQLTVTTHSDAQYMFIYVSNDSVEPQMQVEEGSTATSFEPYVGGIPAPNPDYPQDINVVTGEQTVKVVGKNLWGGFINEYSLTDHDVAFVNYKDGSISANGTASSSAYSMYAAAAASGGRTRQFPAGIYTLSGGTSAVRAMFIIVGPGTSYTTDTTSGKVTFTLSEMVNGYIRAYVPSGTSANETIHPQLEFNSTASDYEPYQSQSYPISLGSIELCKLGDYQDYIYKSGDDWYVHKEIGKLNIVSSGIAAFNSHSGSHITVNYSDATVEQLSAPAVTNISNRFIGCTSTQTWGGTVLNGVSQGTNNNYLQFSLPISVATTQAEVRTYFDNHPTTVYYTLATPTDTQITDATLVTQLNALAGAKSYNNQTNLVVTATGENLPAALCVEAYQKSLNGLLGAIERLGA